MEEEALSMAYMCKQLWELQEPLEFILPSQLHFHSSTGEQGQTLILSHLGYYRPFLLVLPPLPSDHSLLSLLPSPTFTE